MTTATVEHSEKRLLPGRSARYGVGKEIGGAVYLHRDYEGLLGSAVTEAKRHLPAGFDYTIVKYVMSGGVVSFIHSPDFNNSPEPIAGDIWTISSTGKATFRKQLIDPYIYHHKWLMVKEDYPHFNVEESKARSAAWSALPGIDRSRIGRRSYWIEVVLPRLHRLESGSEG